jgi:DNA-binding response OmpR family regulator
MRVLVIEDDHDVADILARLLWLHGKDVEVAYDGLTGLETALLSFPDVVISDISMPGLDGYQVARKIRERAYGMPVLIALSGFEKDSTDPATTAFDHFFVKPADFKTLNSVIDRLYQRRHLN